MDISKAYPNPVNVEKLAEELRTSFPSVSMSDSGIRIHNVVAEDEPLIDTIIGAHNASVQTDEQKLQSAQSAALNQARDYLRKQLLNPSPNITNIYNNVKSQVDANPQLLQIVNNKLSIAQLAYGWTVASMNAGANNTDRARYLECILSVVGLLA